MTDDLLSPTNQNYLDGNRWFVQFCLFGAQRGNMAVMPALDAMRQNLAEAQKPVPMNFWVTIGMANNRAEAMIERKRLQRELQNKPPTDSQK